MAKSTKAPKIVTRSLDAKGFYSDFSKEGMLYAALIRSPANTGIVKDIKIPDMPEGYSLFTAKDIPGSKIMEFNNTVTKILGYKNVNYTGEPLGIIVGPDELEIKELTDRAAIYFDIQNLESALTNVMKSSSKNKILSEKLPSPAQDSLSDLDNLATSLNELPSLDSVIDNKNQNTQAEKVVGERIISSGSFKELSQEEADKELFESEKYVIEESWSQTIVNPKWQEPSGAFCYTEGEKLHVYAPTKWTFFLQKVLSEALNLNPELIFIHKTKTSSLYSDGLWRTTQIAVQTALASYLLKKPVKLMLSQSEQEEFMGPGVKTDITYKAAVNEEGRIKALKVNIAIDVGSENPFAQEITDRLAIASVNFYKTKNLYIKAQAKTSKNPPTTISIKGVDSQSFFAIENQIQKISNITGIFPDDVRTINLEKVKDFPFEFEDSNILEVIQNTVRMSDFNRKYASFHMDSIDRVEQGQEPFFAFPLRGIGLSCAYNNSGYHGISSFSYYPKIEVTLLPDEKVSIHTIQTSNVNQDIWRTTASKILELPKTNVQIDSNFTLEEMPKSPEDSFSTIGIINQLIKKCCLEIQKKRFHQPLPITSKKSVSASAKNKWNKDNFCGTPFMSSSLISCVTEVELDPYTYNEKIRGIWLSIDCGEILDEAAALRTVRLEVQKELSLLVQGKNVTCDEVFIQFIPSKNAAGQVGELVHNSLPAAFASALSSALATQVTKLPCTERQLYTLIKQRGEVNQ
ncbi:Aerobic-type carbon monoxide dehydrogenase, large subunit [Treponema sp. JC4]|uniref:molybdopterin cofactor-binding domain-containing protein n=1 Tax=Treponema sp. JC4 TaxID=1124982 RepID=UPI00025B0E87|nr:molybdopterin cofactor-binding domain-containing protein [Treponema sp. JC4]EID84113.1 Aerobic-type carbon monoxide dehydrogenase, large subunit [Treponema sp. JC4]